MISYNKVGLKNTCMICISITIWISFNTSCLSYSYATDVTLVTGVKILNMTNIVLAKLSAEL